MKLKTHLLQEHSLAALEHLTWGWNPDPALQCQSMEAAFNKLLTHVWFPWQQPLKLLPWIRLSVINCQHGNINPSLFSLFFSISLSDMFCVTKQDVKCCLYLHPPTRTKFQWGSPLFIVFLAENTEGSITYILNEKESDFRSFLTYPCASRRALFFPFGW